MHSQLNDIEEGQVNDQSNTAIHYLHRHVPNGLGLRFLQRQVWTWKVRQPISSPIHPYGCLRRSSDNKRALPSFIDS